MTSIRIRSALVSVFHKEGLDDILHMLESLGVKIYSTGGTHQFIQSLGIEVVSVEELTGFASILDGRVKTLHPKIFGGILARRDEGHLAQLVAQDIPEIDLVIVDLYPFEETVRQTAVEKEIIEKIDIGGISLIRAAAKNYKDVVIIPSRSDYAFLAKLLEMQDGHTELEDRRLLASRAFQVSSNYDTQIYNYFNQEASSLDYFQESKPLAINLRYGENPHQSAAYYGHLERLLTRIQGKELSYNNLVDVDAAIWLMSDMKSYGPTMAILKHTNVCGIASRDNIQEAWQHALAGDPVSAFGGVIISSQTIDVSTAAMIDTIFYEVLIAPSYSDEALSILKKKKNRILLTLNYWPIEKWHFKNLLEGVIRQEKDNHVIQAEDLNCVTTTRADEDRLADLVYATRIVKHLKSNAIAIVHDRQLIGMGCGQTSRVDALEQAIKKAHHFNFSDRLVFSSMASEAFFPFPDCVAIADREGIRSVVQPGGSVKDKESIAYCEDHGMAMYLTGIRHFKH